MADPPDYRGSDWLPTLQRFENLEPQPGERLDDLEVYRKLLELSAIAQQLSARCWSKRATSALQIASAALRQLASAFYRVAVRERE